MPDAESSGPPPNAAEFLTVDQVAVRLVLSSATIRRMIDRGDFPADRFGGSWRIPQNFLEQLRLAADLKRTTGARFDFRLGRALAPCDDRGGPAR